MVHCEVQFRKQCHGEIGVLGLGVYTYNSSPSAVFLTVLYSHEPKVYYGNG